MNKLLALILLTLCSSAIANKAPPPPFALEAKAIIEKFQKQLKTALLSAIKKGGLPQAIITCHQQAPKVAQSISQQSGWQIKRISTRARNKKNSPTAEQLAVLNYFEQQKSLGKKINTMEWWSQKDNKEIYMKPIPTGSICSQCHGENIPKNVKTMLNKYYPEDKATGYKIGDIRGAFVVEKVVK